MQEWVKHLKKGDLVVLYGRSANGVGNVLVVDHVTPGGVVSTNRGRFKEQLHNKGYVYACRESGKKSSGWIEPYGGSL